MRWSHPLLELETLLLSGALSQKTAGEGEERREKGRRGGRRGGEEGEGEERREKERRGGRRKTEEQRGRRRGVEEEEEEDASFTRHYRIKATCTSYSHLVLV